MKPVAEIERDSHVLVGVAAMRGGGGGEEAKLLEEKIRKIAREEIEQSLQRILRAAQ